MISTHTHTHTPAGFLPRAHTEGGGGGGVDLVDGLFLATFSLNKQKIMQVSHPNFFV